MSHQVILPELRRTVWWEYVKGPKDLERITSIVLYKKVKQKHENETDIF